MNRRNWYIPVLILAAIAAVIAMRWSSLPESLPAHFDLQGNAGGTMSRNTLLYYPLIGAALCLVGYVISRINRKLQTGLVVLVSGICLVLSLSVIVTLTSGTMPIFMLAEPVILLAAVVACVVCIVRSLQKHL